MIKLLFVLLLSHSFAFAGPREEAQDILLRFNTETGVVTRLEAISRIFLGLPYGVGGPLGEGPSGRYDQDPLYRFDTFDCTTYVETIMALALARDINEFENHLDQIRYENGEVDYLKRNHFTDLWWIPFNIRNGYLKEINHLVVPQNQILTAEAQINLPGWLKSIKLEEIKAPMASVEERQFLLEELRAQSVNYTIETARVPYLSINMLVKNPKLLDRIPHGTLVNFVRPNWDLTDLIGTHQNISHQGFLFRKGKVLYLRHASTSGPKKVMDVPFIDYLKPFVNHATMKGIHLMQMSL